MWCWLRTRGSTRTRHHQTTHLLLGVGVGVVVVIPPLHVQLLRLGGQ